MSDFTHFDRRYIELTEMCYTELAEVLNTPRFFAPFCRGENTFAKWSFFLPLVGLMFPE